MKGCLFIIYKQEHLYRSEEIIKYSMFQWILFVIHRLMISCMIGFYVYKSLSLYNGWLEKFQINNQMILYFVNLLSKEVPVNTSYPRTFNQIYGYLYSRIGLTSVG